MEKKTILFPTDFSEMAEFALKEAVEFGKNLKAFKLIIYHVYHRPVVEGSSAEIITSSLIGARKAIEKNFDILVSRHPELKTIDYEFRMELGLSVDNILNFTKNEKVDIIIMATEGARGFGELWGTKTASILQSVDIPVLVLTPNTSLLNIHKIGLACDYSENTDFKSLGVLGEIAENLNLKIEVITLNRSEKSLTAPEKLNREGMLHLLERVPSTFSFTNHENVEEGIVEYCVANDIGLIAILPKHYNFIEDLFHESLIEKMAFHSPIPLLVLK